MWLILLCQRLGLGLDIGRVRAEIVARVECVRVTRIGERGQNRRHCWHGGDLVGLGRVGKRIQICRWRGRLGVTSDAGKGWDGRWCRDALSQATRRDGAASRAKGVVGWGGRVGVGVLAHVEAVLCRVLWEEGGLKINTLQIWQWLQCPYLWLKVRVRRCHWRGHVKSARVGSVKTRWFAHSTQITRLQLKLAVKILKHDVNPSSKWIEWCTGQRRCVQ